MKKSSLITVALASLVGLVGCNQQPAASKTVAQKTSEAFVKAFFRENYYVNDDDYLTNANGFKIKDENGNYIKVEGKQGEVTDDTFDNTGMFLNPEEAEEMVYYKIPELNDSYAMLFAYYSGITDDDLAGYGTDGNPIRDIALYNTIIGAVNPLFRDDAEDLFGFETFAYISDEVIELMDVNEDGDNDYGYSEWVNYGTEDFDPDTDIQVILEFISYVYKFEGDTTYYSLVQANVYSYADAVGE